MIGKPIKPVFQVRVIRDGQDAFTVTVVGRVAWMLLSLMRAGNRGITPIERPAPRHSDYTFRLRNLGIRVETIDESHGGSFAGSHARYVLKDQVAISGGNLLDYLNSPEGRREVAA